MRTSKRIKEREPQTVHSERQQLRKLDTDRPREPSSCTEPDCKWPARQQGSVEFGGGAEQCNGTMELFQLR